MNEHDEKQWLSEHAVEVLVRAGITPGEVVLDFGCGRGNYAIPAGQLVTATGWVYAVDRNPAALAELKEALPRGLNCVAAMQVDDLHLPLAPASVDVVLFFDVLHLVEEVPTLLQEMKRVMKGSGRVVVYPMHLERADLIQDMEAAGFQLAAELEPWPVLVFASQNRPASWSGGRGRGNKSAASTSNGWDGNLLS